MICVVVAADVVVISRSIFNHLLHRLVPSPSISFHDQSSS